MGPRLLRLLVVLLAAWVAGPARAQMIPSESVDSIDAQVLGAKTVVVGRVAEAVSSGPGGVSTATVAVAETLKGEPQATLRVALPGRIEELRAWQAAATPVLFLVREDRGPWSTRTIDLDNPNLLVSREDFTLVRGAKQLREIVRDLARKPTEARAYRLHPPEDDVGRRWKAAFGSHGAGGLTVPLDAQLERRAWDAIRARDPAGLFMIESFKSEANAARLRSLLKDPAYDVIETGTDHRGVETRRYPLRVAANRVLRSWGEAAPAVETETADALPTLEWLRVTSPDDLLLVRRTHRLKNLEIYHAGRLTEAQFDALLTAKGLTSLSLTSAGIDDARMRRIAGLRELRAVNLDGNPLTDKGLRELSRLPRLTEASLNGTAITDEGLAALRRARPGIQIHLDRATRAVRSIARTSAVCDRAAYALLPGDLGDWSSEPVGSVVGALGWSRTPSGRDYLGPLGQQAATLTVKGLPRHRNVRVEIELFVIGSWDGDGRLGTGPDVLDVTVPGVGTMLHATFFNNDDDEGAAELPLQSFPDSFPGAGHRAYTGAAETRTLGFEETWNGQPFRRDAVYGIGATFAHTGSEIRIVLTGLNAVQGGVGSLLDDERWGIGGLVVRTD